MEGGRDFVEGGRDFVEGGRDFVEGGRDFEEGGRDFVEGGRDFGGREGRARRRCRREWRKALRGAVAEGIRKRQPNKDNCTFGSVFTSNVVLDLEPKVSNYRNVALVVLGSHPNRATLEASTRATFC